MVGDRVVIGVHYVGLATNILHEPVIQLYFFCPFAQQMDKVQ
jgi:hypothetical protein